MLAGKRIDPREVFLKPDDDQRLRANGCLHGDNEWIALTRAFGRACVRCGGQWELTRDHIIPKSKGGCDCIANIQPMCARCNGLKGNDNTDYRYDANPDWAKAYDTARSSAG